MLERSEEEGSADEAAEAAFWIRGLGLSTKCKWQPDPGHGKQVDQVGAPEGLDEVRVLVTVRRELVVKADHAADRRRELRET